MSAKRASARSSAPYELLLLLTAMIWGTGFVAQRLGMQSLGPFAFNGARFAVGSLCLLPVLALRRVSWASLKAAALPGLAAGCVLALAAQLQQVGLVYTTAGKAGFITGLYVVLVPIAAIFFGKRTPARTWIGAACAFAGLALLSFEGGLSMNRGDAFVLASAFFWTAHIMVLDRWSGRVDPLALSCVQFAVCSVICWIVGSFVETWSVQAIVEARGPILYGGVMSIGVAYTLQAVAQSRAHPSKAAVIMSLESAFAAVSGFLFLKETMSPREFGGCALMLFGMVVAQVGGTRRAKARG